MARHVANSGRGKARRNAGIVLLVLSGLFATMPFMLMIANRHADESLAARHETAARSMSDPTAEQELARARQYNAGLLADGRGRVGEQSDPWSDPGEDTAADEDATYMGLLSTPKDGIMATILYPRLGINLPVRHGTGDATLAAGAGHMHGTSLPVGGGSTHSVISAHTGLADRLMFDRLSLRQGRVGDLFYIKVLDRTLAYKVTDIRVVEPTDLSAIGVQTDRDLVTLVTCTPYGINTQRLLVTGERTDMPHPAPDPAVPPGASGDMPMILWIAGVWAILALTGLAATGALAKTVGRIRAKGRTNGSRKRKDE